MFYYIIFNILVRNLYDNEASDVDTVIVRNYNDYLFHFDKTNDHLNIEVPNSTIFLISALEGYEATAHYWFGTSLRTIYDKLVPNPKNRVVYFTGRGYINVTATKNNVDFSFHTLVLSKINKSFDNLIISTSPYEQYRVHYNIESTSYRGFRYNSTFSNNQLLWFVSANFTIAQLYEKVYKYIYRPNFYPPESHFSSDIGYYSYPSLNTDDRNDVPFYHFGITPTGYRLIHTRSKLILIEKVDSLSSKYSSNIDVYLKPNFTNFNFYTNYRAIFKFSTFRELIESEILTRGQDHLKETNILYSNILDDGIYSFDFSIYNNYSMLTNNKLLIFPTVSELRKNIIYGDQPLAFIQKIDFRTLYSGNANYVADTDMNVKVINYYVYENQTRKKDFRFIISTSPTEKLIIGSYSTSNLNYTNDILYKYIMASLQDIETTVVFTGNVAFKKFEIGSLVKIEVNSTDKIKGPFIAYIEKDAECNFETMPIGELKEGYIDDERAYFDNEEHNEKDIFISNKYGVYYNHTLSLKNSNVTFNDTMPILVETFNLVYFQTTSNWKGEIVSPKLEDNLIGPQYDRTSFYISNANSIKICMLLWRDDGRDDTFVVHLRSVSTVLLGPKGGAQYNCSRVIVFNDIPTKFSINQKESNKYHQLDLEFSSLTCMFPAVSYYFYGFNFTKTPIFAVVYNSYGESMTLYMKNYNDTFSKYINEYNYYGPYEYSIIQIHGSINDYGYMGFKDNQEGYVQNGNFGMLPDEPLIYYDFHVNRELGIYTFGENIYTPIEKGNDIVNNGNGGDNDNDKPSSSSNSSENEEENDFDVYLDKINGNDVIDMTDIKTLRIYCSESTLFFIHYMKGFTVTYYNTDTRKKIGQINENGENKIINFGSTRGRIEIEKTSTRSLNLNNIFSYSYVNVNDVKNKKSSTTNNNIFISSDLNVYFSIKEKNFNSSDYNYTLSANENFYLWFTFPIHTSINSKLKLPHSHNLYLDNQKTELNGEINTNDGFNFVYCLYNASSTNENGFDVFKASPIEDDDLSGIDGSYIVNSVYEINSNNGILNKKYVEKEVPKKKDTRLLGIIICCVTVVVIIVIIVVIACVVKNQKKKKRVSNNNSDSLQDQENKLQNQNKNVQEHNTNQ